MAGFIKFKYSRWLKIQRNGRIAEENYKIQTEIFKLENIKIFEYIDMTDMVENLKTEGTNELVFEQVNVESPHKSTESRCLEQRVHSY